MIPTYHIDARDYDELFVELHRRQGWEPTSFRIDGVQPELVPKVVVDYERTVDGKTEQMRLVVV